VIKKSEILEASKVLGLRPDVVEKDYMLSWLLAGISNHPLLSSKWIFKGGTCLKKCYFETYRFSEDLDFTITDISHLEPDFLKEKFIAISSWLYDETGIQCPEDQMSFKVKKKISRVIQLFWEKLDLLVYLKEQNQLLQK